MASTAGPPTRAIAPLRVHAPVRPVRRQAGRGPLRRSRLCAPPGWPRRPSRWSRPPRRSSQPPLLDGAQGPASRPLDGQRRRQPHPQLRAPLVHVSSASLRSSFVKKMECFVFIHGFAFWMLVRCEIPRYLYQHLSPTTCTRHFATSESPIGISAPAVRTDEAKSTERGDSVIRRVRMYPRLYHPGESRRVRRRTCFEIRESGEVGVHLPCTKHPSPKLISAVRQRVAR